MDSGYFLIGIVTFVAILACGAIYAAVRLLAPFKPNKAKNSPYECGFDQGTSVSQKFPIHYYRVAILFVLFDLEIAFLLPWAASLKVMNWVGFTVGFLFTIILGVGLLYEWKKGALKWQ